MLKKIANYLSNIKYTDFEINNNNLHIAFLCKNNTIYFTGNNSDRTKIKSVNYLYHSTHAEVDVVRKYKNSNMKKKLDIIVVRIGKDNSWLFSKPCCNCMAFLNKQKFLKNIYYYNQTTFEKLKEI